MKRTALTFLSLSALAWAASAQIQQEYLNTATVTSPLQISAYFFNNQGVFNISGVEVVDNEGYIEGTPEIFAYHTQYTTNFLNTGFMASQPGFVFDDETATASIAAKSFNNAGNGVIIGFDAQALQEGSVVVNGSFLIPPILSIGDGGPGANSPEASILTINALYATNSGKLQVGDMGSINLTSSGFLSLAYGSEASGTVSDADTNNITGRGYEVGLTGTGTTAGTNWYFSPPAFLYDLYWGETNGTADLTTFVSDVGAPPDIFTPEVLCTNRLGDEEYIELPLNSPYSFTPYVYEEEVITGSGKNEVTNIYYTVVMINEVFASPNISDAVGFVDFGEGPTEPVIQFAEPVLDVVTGETVTNAVYLLDTGSVSSAVNLAQNILTIGEPYYKYDCFELTTTTPYEWAETSPAIGGFDSSIIYDSTLYSSNKVQMTNYAYGVQINGNPEELDGLFPLTLDIEGSSAGLGMPTLTNRGGSIAINANRMDLTGARLRANGTISLNVSNMSGVPTGMDFDSAIANIGNSKTALSVSNLFPAQYSRLRGDIMVYSADWQNTMTNNGLGDSNKANYPVFVHLLVVDQALQGSFTPSVVDFTGVGSSVVMSDPLNVLESATFKTPSLVVDNALYFSGVAGNLGTNNLPGLQNLTVTANGSLAVANLLDLGVPTNSVPPSPTTRKYPISSVTNLGVMSASGILLQPQTFANGGSVICTNGGSIILDSRTNLLGVGGSANYLTADDSIYLSSVSIQASNSTITAGVAGGGSLNLYATSQLTDWLPGVPSTNVYVTNFWYVNNGFSLTAKPATGDLFATQITTVAANQGEEINHVWAGADLGPNAAGFYNNAVIGHLILDRQASGAVLHFSAAGKKSAMYVDFLELRDLTYSDYHNGLVVDPNMTIYFANCNFNPTKLSQVYTNIIWVPQFAGPNSSAEVLYRGGSNCVMNYLVATSSQISTDLDNVPNSKKEPYILDNPNTNVGTIPCPSTVTSSETLYATNSGSVQELVIWVVGEGTATPALAKFAPGQVISQKAIASPGWTFLNWSGAYSAAQPNISFKVPGASTNAVLTATFIRNPFPEVAGVYSGLFYPTSGLTASNSGFVSLTVTTNGAFSGQLLIGASKYPFSSQFYGNGITSLYTTNGKSVLTVTLQIDTSNTLNPSTQITGSVSGTNWTAGLSADLAPKWTSKHQAPEAGTYTMALSGNSNAAASPGGSSYGTVSVTGSGVVTATLNLADSAGPALSQTASISALGTWPLFMNSSSGAAQTLMGWVSFNTNAPATFGGTVNWIRSQGKGGVYTNGFATNGQLTGNLYSSAKTLQLTNPTITLNGGNLAVALTNAVSLTAATQTYQNAGKNLTLTITKQTGLFTGAYKPLGAKTNTPLNGVVLQGLGEAQGFFLGTNQSGSVLLEGN